MVSNPSMKGIINKIQSTLNFEGFKSYQFCGNKGLGKIGVGGFILGVLLGISVTSLGFCLLIAITLENPPSFVYSLVG